MSEQSRFWIYDLIQHLIKEGYTGNIEINFFSGGITNVNKFESIKPPKEQAVNK